MKSHVSFVHEGKGGHNCEFCGKLYATMNELKKHSRSVHEGITYDCQICSKQFKGKAGLKDHVETVHEGKKPSVKCPLCDKCVVSNHVLKRHIDQVHEKKRPHVCEICNERFGQKAHLVTHIKGKHKGGI